MGFTLKIRLWGFFFLVFVQKPSIKGLFQETGDEYMIVNHENDAEFYLVINNAEYSMHVVCAMKLL